MRVWLVLLKHRTCRKVTKVVSGPGSRSCGDGLLLRHPVICRNDAGSSHLLVHLN